jgi:hypothetical protein
MKLSLLALSLFFAAFVASCFNALENNPPSSEKAEIFLSGTIDLAPELREKADPLAVIFVMARTPEGRLGAVKKLLPPFQYPLAFELTAQDLMIPGMDFHGEILPGARLDADANANPPQPGDILGVSDPKNVSLGTRNVKILLNQVVK